MTSNERNNAYEQFIEAWGATAQLTMVLEETAELQKEVCKQLRGKDNKVEITDEIADVEIMLEQLKFIFAIDQTDLEVRKEFKILRTLKSASAALSSAGVIRGNHYH